MAESIKHNVSIIGKIFEKLQQMINRTVIVLVNMQCILLPCINKP